MSITVEDIELGDITVFAGHNDTGKTKTICDLLDDRYDGYLHVIGVIGDRERTASSNKDSIEQLLSPLRETTVFLKNPETKLHVKELEDIGKAIMEAAEDGCNVILETQSDHLFLVLQVLVAERTLANKDGRELRIPLYWFDKENGEVTITRGNLDADGTYGEWPVDWTDRILDLERRFLDAHYKIKQNNLKEGDEQCGT